ncbi:hypothetical protein SO802_021011 [Lithocarpus litseifolius]|uniref:Uncharacterized protein n=1 Tax=Lithocarpus litseifolius TaxID=425828 RepID=A0AAW2CH43_9ROSI
MKYVWGSYHFLPTLNLRSPTSQLAAIAISTLPRSLPQDPSAFPRLDEDNRMSQLMKLFKGLEGALALVKNLTYRILISNVLSYWRIQFYSTKFNTYSFGHLLKDVKDDTKPFCCVEFKLVPKKGSKSA